MVRINLLPREISEKRNFETAIKIAALAALVVYLVLFAVFGFTQWMLSQRTAELQSHKDLAATLSAQASALQIFEDKEADLAQRQIVMQEAVKQRIDWGRLLNELSLVLPTDVWLDSLQAAQDTGLTLSAIAVDSATDVPDMGHKAVARTLARLANIEMLSSVWLTSSQKTELPGVADAPGQPVLRFQVTCEVMSPDQMEAISTDAPDPSTTATP
ncbi:MAG: PilN domain-containing protein [Actinobacteria bacterium]|nr:PilN domain-containing protein [Actinomycetota bacterium]MCL5887339.1 PilN domain-containing protein [Actinomycetota bacterium]